MARRTTRTRWARPGIGRDVGGYGHVDSRRGLRDRSGRAWRPARDGVRALGRGRRGAAPGRAGRRRRIGGRATCASSSPWRLTAARREGTGILEGAIASERRGEGGFGYDPIFVPTGEEPRVAELGNAWKRSNSHRARAAAHTPAVPLSHAISGPLQDYLAEMTELYEFFFFFFFFFFLILARVRDDGSDTGPGRLAAGRRSFRRLPWACHQLTSAPKMITFAIT